MMTREQAIELLKEKPYKLGKMLGFTKLKKINNEWIKMMVRSKEDKTLKACRGTYKTTCVSLALAIIMVTLPNKRTLFMRKTDTDVKEVIKQVKNILLSQQMKYLVKLIYGCDLVLTVSSATEISTNLTNDIKGTSQLVGMGIKSSLTGKHFDYIFTDDIVNIQDRISRAEREQTKIVYQELQNIKNRDGRIFNTGTTWHKDDAFSIMPDAIEYNCYSVELEEIISKEELEYIKSQMLPSLFAANYELRFVASEDVIFSNPQFTDDMANIEQGIAQVDAAFYGEDYTALTICRKLGGKYYILGKCWRKHVEECYSDIKNLCEKYMVGKLHIEKNADKGFVAKDLRNLGLRVNGYNESMNKYMKIVTYLKIEWDNVIFETETDRDYVDQICDYNENASHDDCPDSLSSIIRVLYNKQDEYKPLWN